MAEPKKTKQELEQELITAKEETERKTAEAVQAQMDGRGRLELKTPIRAGGEDITELIYDFNTITGLEIVDAMDSDPNAIQVFKITYRQALKLFANAAAKATPKVDARDIMEQLGAADAVIAVQNAMLFFNVSARAGRLRISKK